MQTVLVTDNPKDWDFLGTIRGGHRGGGSGCPCGTGRTISHGSDNVSARVIQIGSIRF